MQETTNTDWLQVPFHKKKGNKKDIAITYFQLVAAYNNILLNDTEVSFLAGILVNKGLLTSNYKLTFAEDYKASIPYINNLIHKLKKKKLLVKKDTIITIHPKLIIDLIGNNFIFSFKCQI